MLAQSGYNLKMVNERTDVMMYAQGVQHAPPNTRQHLFLHLEVQVLALAQTPAGSRDFTPPAPPRRPVHCCETTVALDQQSLILS
jgi:hypothetical protein